MVTAKKAGQRSAKKLAFNFVCSLAGHVMSSGIAFFLTPYLVNRLGIERYGLYPSVLEISVLFSIVYGIVNSTCGRYVAIETEKGDNVRAAEYFSTAFYSNIVFSAVLVLPMALLTAFPNLFFNIEHGAIADLRIFIGCVLLSVLVDALASVFGSVYLITDRLDIRALQQLFSATVKALALYLLFSLLKPSLALVGVAVLLSSSVASLMQVIVFKKHITVISPSCKAISFSCFKRLWRSGFRYTLNRISSMLMGGVLLILANVFFTPTASGAYSVAFVLVNALSGMINTVAAVFVPPSAKCFARGEKKRLRDSVARDQRLVGFFSAVAVSLVAAFSPKLFSLWLNEKCGELLVTVTLLLSLPLLTLSSAAPIINVAMVVDRTRRLSLLFFTAGLLNVALALLVMLCTDIGVAGFALVSCVTQLVWYGVAVPIFAKKLFLCRASMFAVPVIRTLLAAALSYAVCAAVMTFFDIETLTELVISCIVAGVLSAFISFFCIFGFPKIRFLTKKKYSHD